MVNLDRFEQIKAARGSDYSGKGYIIKATRDDIRWNMCPWLATSDDEEGAKAILDKIEAALLRGAKCIDVRGV